MILAGAAAALVTSPVHADPTDAEIRWFRDEVLAVARRQYPKAPPTPVGFSGIAWGQHSLDVHNVYRTIGRLPPSEREQAIAGWLSDFSPTATAAMNATVSKIGDWAFVRPLLRPLLQPATAVEHHALISKPFSSDLRICYAVDLDQTMLYISPDRFARWCVGIEEVHRAALANLDTAVDNVPIAVEADHDTPIVAMVANGDSYDSSRILLPSIRARLFGILGTPVLAAVPARDAFFAWSPKSSACAENLERVHKANETEAHPLSDEIFLLGKDGVRPARPEELNL